MTDDPNNVSAVPAADAGWGEYGKDAPIARLAWALARIADMKDRDGNAIEMHRDELRAIAKTALATPTSIQPPPAARDELHERNAVIEECASLLDDTARNEGTAQGDFAAQWAQEIRTLKTTAAPSVELQDDLSQRLTDELTASLVTENAQLRDRLDALQAVVDELVRLLPQLRTELYYQLDLDILGDAARRLAKAPQNG